MVNQKIPIFMYHSIEAMPKSTVMRSLHVHPLNFKLQMWLLKILGYKGLSMRELTPYLNGEKQGKVVGLTFDDGYQNNLTNVAPVLKKYGFSATCYIVSDKIGQTNNWDEKLGITQRPLMTDIQIKEWIGTGMDIGSHTQNHINLIESNPDLAKEEIEKCKINLEKKFNCKVDDFCYPFGIYNDTSAELVRKAGYQTSTTMKRGRNTIQTDMLELLRIPVNYRTLPHLFLLKLLTKYEDKRE